MYAGHAALALAAKAKRPRLSLALLVPVAFAPDWIELIGDNLNHSDRAISHSLVSVGIGALLVGLLYFQRHRSLADAGVLSLTYCSHWAADFITGLKPTWPGGPEVGLVLYDKPAADLLVESILILICWWYYRRSLPPESRARRVGYLIPATLIGLQVLFEVIQSPAI